jgi:hypothetical protein
VDRDEAVFGDHLNIVGAAPAHPGVRHRNERNAGGRSFLDRRLRRVKERKLADIIAAVKSKRNLGLARVTRLRPDRVRRRRLGGDGRAS